MKPDVELQKRILVFIKARKRTAADTRLAKLTSMIISSALKQKPGKVADELARLRQAKRVVWDDVTGWA